MVVEQSRGGECGRVRSGDGGQQRCATITAAASAVCGTAAMTVDQVVASVAVTPPADTVVEADTVRLAAQATDRETTWPSTP